jgi:hypothetical protein
MTTFEIPTISTERLKLRAFQAGDLNAYAAMQANPEVTRFLVDGRTYKSGHEQIFRKHRVSSSHSTGQNRSLPTYSTILGTRVRDRGSNGTTRLAVRALSVGSP